MSRKIISSIDIGSDSIKLVVGEYFEGRLNILSASKIDNHGIERGKIVDEESTVNAIKMAVQEASNMLGLKIEKCILGLNMINARIVKSGNAIKILGEDPTVTGKDVDSLMNKCADGKVLQDYVLGAVIPVEFTIDNDKVVKKPVGVKTENLGLKCIVVSLPKDYVSAMLDIVNKAGLKVMDVIPNALGDYNSFKNDDTKDSVGAIVNLGAEMSTVSILNRGIITNSGMFPLGGKNIINDISYVAKIGEAEASAIYKDIVLANSRFANPNEYRIVGDLDGEEIKINQFDISEVSSSRIDEILNLAKKQINVLTKKEISYIIITGGLTELKDFNLSLEKVFGHDAKIGKLACLGARDNSYSSAIGIIEYFIYKLEIRGKGISMFTEAELNNLTTVDKEPNANNNTLLGKVVGYFFDN